MSRIIEIEYLKARAYPGVSSYNAYREAALLALTEGRVVRLLFNGRVTVIDPGDLLDPIIGRDDGAPNDQH